MRIELESDHPEAAQLVKAALASYLVNVQVHEMQTRGRQPHPGETTELLEHRADRLKERAAAVQAMHDQIPGGQAGPPRARTP